MAQNSPMIATFGFGVVFSDQTLDIFKAADEASAKDKARCATLPAEVKTPPTYMERMTMREDMMKARLAALEAVKPSLQALYAALTPEQKAIFDKPMRMGMGTGSMHRPHPNRG